MLTRRTFLAGSAVAVGARAATKGLTSTERIDRALKGEDVDRSPFSYWHHFHDQNESPEKHAASTLEFHRKFGTDLVKVMSDYPYPKPAAEWFDLRVEENPFPSQVRALQIIKSHLAGTAYFVETLFNPWKVAENLSSPEAVRSLKAENPQRLRAALDVIARSEANHARRAARAGASGMFLAIANSVDPDYAEWSAPYDKMVMSAVPDLPMNTLHIHGDRVSLEHFYAGWPAPVLNYSVSGTRIPMADVRAKFPGVLMGGLDEVNYPKLQPGDIKREWREAMHGAGKKLIFTPGCSVPDDTPDDRLMVLSRFFGAV